MDGPVVAMEPFLNIRIDIGLSFTIFFRLNFTAHLSKFSHGRRQFSYFCAMLKTAFTTLIAILFVSVVSAQEKWDLLKCVQYAYDNNISIKQEDIRAQIAQFTYKQSNLSKYPNLNLTSNVGLNTGRSIDRTTNQFTTESIFYNSFNLQSNVDVFNWFSKKNTIAGNKLEAMAASAGVDKLKNDIALNIAAAYLQALLAKEQVNASKVLVAQTIDQLERTKKLVSAGSLPELNQLQLESQLATDSVTFITATGTEIQSLLLIKSLLNLDASVAFDIVTPPIDKIPIDPIAELQPEVVYQLAIKNMPQQKLNNFRLLAAEKFANAAKGQLYPSIGAGIGFGTNYSSVKNSRTLLNTTDQRLKVGYVDVSNTPVYDTFSIPTYSGFFANEYFRQISDNFNNGVGINISVPIFNGKSARINWQKQKLNVKSLSLQQDLDIMTLKQDIYKAYTDAMTALQKFNASTKAVEAAEKAYDFSLKRYNAELLNTIDLIISQNNLFRARIDRLSSQYDYVFKMKVLEFYKGLGIRL
jgi:outer membrane protein